MWHIIATCGVLCYIAPNPIGRSDRNFLDNSEVGEMATSMRTATTTTEPTPQNIIRISSSRKISGCDGPYSSRGSAVEMELRIPANFLGDELWRWVAIHQDLLEKVVSDHLDKFRNQPAPASGSNGHSANGTARHEEDDQVEEDGEEPVYEGDRGNPRINACALLKHCDSLGSKVKARLFTVAKQLNMPRRFVEWSPEDTGYVYSLIFPEEEPEPRKPRRATGRNRVPF